MGELKQLYMDEPTNQFTDDPVHKWTVATNLVYDTKTKIIYYKIVEYNNVGYMSPYISENGKYCRFIDKKIVEVN